MKLYVGFRTHVRTVIPIDFATKTHEMREATRVDIGWKLFSTILQIGKPLRTVKNLSQFVVDF